MEVITTTAFLSDPLCFKNGCAIVPERFNIDDTVLYIALKYGFVSSARFLAFCSLTVETSFMAFVICCVLCMLLLLRLMSLMDAISFHRLYLKDALHSSIALTSAFSLSPVSSLVERMDSKISGYFVSI